MKKLFQTVILSSIMLLPTMSFAIDLFSTETGVLVIPEVDVNGEVFYDNVALKLDFSTGTFQLLSADPKPDNISATPLDTVEENDIKMDFMGCTRSGRNEATCHIKLTSLGGFDRKTAIYADSDFRGQSKLFDDLGNTYIASEVIVGNLRSTSVVDQDLIAGIPTLAKFIFKNISPNASNISLLQPEFGTNGHLAGEHFIGDFRNINF